MKKLLFIFFLFCSLFAVAYKWFIVHPGYAPKVNSYGNLYNRLIADSAVHIPNKTCLCTNDNDTTPQLFIYMDTLRGFWNGNFHNIGFGSGGGSGVDTIYVTQIGTGSPQIPLVYAVNGSLRVARLVPGVFTTPFMNADSAAGINVDTTGTAGIAYKLWIIAQYGPPVGGNIYTANGRIQGTSGRYINAAGNSFLLDSVVDPTFALRDHGSNASRWTLVDSGRDIWMQIGQATTSGGGLKQGFQIDVGGVRSGGLSGGSLPYSSFILDSNYTDITDQFGNYILMAPSSFGQPGITFNQPSGIYSFYNLPSTTDTTKKALVYDPATKTLSYLDLWSRAGSVGGGSAPVVQTITAGPTVTINNSTDILQVNSTSLIASLTVTLPTTWPTVKLVKICFTANGTITSGNTMVTSITVVNGSGQTLSQAINPNGSSVLAGENIIYQLIGTVDQRLQ